MKDNIYSVSIVIPNWNGINLLEKHLPTVIKNSPNTEIIIVDDASTDDSVNFIKNNYRQVKVVQKAIHDGYSSNINFGVKMAQGDIVVLLNTDVEPENGYLSQLLTHFQDQMVFAVGCLEKSHEQNEVILRGRGIGWWDKGFYLHKRGEVDRNETAWVSGGSGAFRKSMWNNLGGMDERFNPFYWEDIDLSYRAIEKGWKLVFEAHSIVHHFHESGVIKSVYSNNDVLTIVYRNQLLFIWKHLPKSMRLTHLFWLPVRIIQSLLSGNFSMLQGLFAAMNIWQHKNINK
jgi:GT2 family glycosyltransferase